MVGYANMEEPASVKFETLLWRSVGGVHEFEDLKADTITH